MSLNRNSITKGISRGDYILKRNTGKRVKHDVWTYVDLICNKDDESCIGFVRCRKCYEIYSFKPQNGIKHLITHPCDNKRLNSVNGYVPVNEEVKEIAKRAALEFCSVDLHPPEALKGKGLLNLIQMGINIGASMGLVKAHKLFPDPTTISRCLPQEVEKIRIEDISEIKLALKEERISFSISAWTSKNKHNFITHTAHYIRESWSLENRILYTSSFPQKVPYNAKNIREEIEHKWDLLGLSMEDFKKAHIITDEGENIKKALEGFKRSSCLAHCLSDVLRHTFDSNYWILEAKQPEVIKLLNESKYLVTFLKQSGLIQCLPRMVHEDCESQWNIKISMLESILEQWNEMQDLLQKQGHMHEIKHIHKTLLQDLITFLKPFKQESDKLREEKRPTLQFALLMKARLKKHLDTIHTKVENVEIMSKVGKRASFYFQRTIVIGKEQKIATFLTPSFRRMLSAEERDEVIRDLRKTYGPFQHGTPTSAEPKPKRLKNVYVEYCVESQVYQTLDEIDIYLIIKNSDCQDILTFWKSQEQRLPRLCGVARRILCIPATTVAAESYNITGNILDTCHDPSPEFSDHFQMDSVVMAKENIDSCNNGSEIGVKIEIEEDHLAEERMLGKIKLESEPPLISDADLHEKMVYFSSDITSKSVHSDRLDSRQESCLEKITDMIKSEPDIVDAGLDDDTEDTSSCINGIDEDFPMLGSPR